MAKDMTIEVQSKSSTVPEILDILQREDIRFVDGRYSGGFVDCRDLDNVVNSILAATYKRDGFLFVRTTYQAENGEA